MPLVEIVSHCYAKELEHYASCLVYQVSSLILHKPEKAGVCLTVCYCEHDENTMKVLRWAAPLMSKHGMSLALQPLGRTEIGRRCIGRNKVAKYCIGDVVWFADVDQVFRDGILDRLAEGEMKWLSEVAMIYPKMIQIHQDHATGDKRTSEVDFYNLKLMDIDPSEFVDKKYRKAIGGVQIVKGDFARRHGYLNDTDWLKPTTTPFGDFRDDLAYRKFCLQHGEIVGVDLPGLYRLRHSRTTYQ